MAHIPVLLKEVIDGLDFKKDDHVFVDVTVGAGGHSSEVCRNFPQLLVVAMDAEARAVLSAEKKLREGGCNFKVKVGNFRNFEDNLRSLGIGRVDKVLFDLGLSSMQIEDSGRGFSFQKNEPLLMTMKEDLEAGDLTAYEIVNSWPKNDIESILKEYGEEGFAGKIAEMIVKERKSRRIENTEDLVRIVKSATPIFYHRKRIHPATKTFQALRIAVNDELNSLLKGLNQAFENLNVGGRIAVISFHSLEDRIVKNFFRELVKKERVKLIYKKPIVPTREEIETNPRSRSAKLRIVEKL